MGELAKTYEQLLEKVVTPSPMEGELHNENVQIERDAFFTSLARSLESRLSYLTIEQCFRIERVASAEGVWGSEHRIDAWTMNGVIPVAYALQTAEDEKNIIRFGTVPINRAGEQLLGALEEADEAYGDASFPT